MISKMMKQFILLIVLLTKSMRSQPCANKYATQNVRAAGDWSEPPLWNALEPKGLLKFDPNLCAHTASIGGLRPNTNYNWKIAVGDSWTMNFGCGNGGNCVFTSSPNGQIRFKFFDDTYQMSTDYNITTIDYTLNLPCVNSFSTKVVRAVGDFNKWLVPDNSVVMTFNPSMCAYLLDLKGLNPNTDYQWKIQIDQDWIESYGCLNAGNCHAITDTTGEILLKFSPETKIPTYEIPIRATTNSTNPSSTSSSTSTSTSTSSSSTTTTTSGISSANPIKECYVCECPTCTNSLFSSKLIRATGDWTVDAGSSDLWLANESRGLMTYNERICMYELIVTGLKPYYSYNWKATINNSFQENYGCDGDDGPNCNFYTSESGSVRFVFNPNVNPPQLTTDYYIDECGDANCAANESCSYCPYDCGYCPQPVCGNGICEESETFLSCPKDCPDELPGCEVFNDQGCRLNSQIDANSGVDKRRWQTPKPGQPGYLPGFQDQYALVGYADIRYKSIDRTSADLCIVAIHKYNATLTYYFSGEPQLSNCKTFTNAQNKSVGLRVIGSDGTRLDISSVNFVWNAQPLAPRPGDYRSGQKGAVAEMFGWPHKDIEKECQLIAKAGYLGVKIFPVTEQLMSNEPISGAMNPWYFMYQPVSYKLEGRGGPREDLISLINTCRSYGLRVYIDVVLNHMTGAGNDLYDHRDPSSACSKWGNKTTSASEDRRSPFFTHSFGYKLNPNTGQPPSDEFPGAALGPDDFHCERGLNVWNDLFLLNNGWLVGLTDINNGKDNVRERQAAYIVELLSLGASGVRIDAAKHIAPQDLSAIFKKVQQKMGGQLPDDFFMWLEVLTGGESGLMWTGPSWYGSSFSNMLLQDLGSQSEVDKIKIWDGLYPTNTGANPMSRYRVVIQNDDHDSQTPGSSSRYLGSLGCILVRNCSVDAHRNFEITLFANPYGVTNNDNDWPIRFVLSSYYFTYGANGIPDGMSSCAKCTVNCDKCSEDVPYMPAYAPGECAYSGTGYTRVHRDIRIINAMRGWMKLPPISGTDLGLPNCN